MQPLKPARLKRGGLIGLVSPASTPAPAEKIEGSVRYLEGLGYRVRVGKHAASAHGYLAGTDEERAGDLNEMIRDPAVRAIFALRGGYGAPRILPLVDYAALRRQPKILSGFSDITALQLAVYRRCRLVTFSGPMPAVEFWQEPDRYTEENFWRLVTSSKKVGLLKNPSEAPLEVLKDGAGVGVLLGGNLSLIVSSFGTAFLPTLKGAILAIEEVDEAPYRVDRMLAQLANSGTSLNAVLFGQFTRCAPKDPAKPHLPVAELLREFAAKQHGPVLANVQYGHVPRKLTLPFGLTARVDSKRCRIAIPESAVV